MKFKIPLGSAFLFIALSICSANYAMAYGTALCNDVDVDGKSTGPQCNERYVSGVWNCSCADTCKSAGTCCKNYYYQCATSDKWPVKASTFAIAAHRTNTIGVGNNSFNAGNQADPDNFPGSGNTAGAWNSNAPTCAYSNAPDHWYSVYVPFRGDLQVDTIGSSFDTVLVVKDPNGNVVGCNDDAPGYGVQSRIVLTNLTRPGWYSVIVDGYSTATGTYTLHQMLNSKVWTKFTHFSGASTDITKELTSNLSAAAAWDLKYIQDAYQSLNPADPGQGVVKAHGVFCYDGYPQSYTSWVGFNLAYYTCVMGDADCRKGLHTHLAMLPGQADATIRNNVAAAMQTNATFTPVGWSPAPGVDHEISGMYVKYTAPQSAFMEAGMMQETILASGFHNITPHYKYLFQNINPGRVVPTESTNTKACPEYDAWEGDGMVSSATLPLLVFTNYTDYGMPVAGTACKSMGVLAKGIRYYSSRNGTYVYRGCNTDGSGALSLIKSRAPYFGPGIPYSKWWDVGNVRGYDSSWNWEYGNVYARIPDTQSFVKPPSATQTVCIGGANQGKSCTLNSECASNYCGTNAPTGTGTFIDDRTASAAINHGAGTSGWTMITDAIPFVSAYKELPPSAYGCSRNGEAPAYTTYAKGWTKLGGGQCYLTSNSAVRGLDPAVFGIRKTLIAADPADLGLDPSLLGLDPAYVGLDPGTMGLDPGTFGLDPGFFGLDPQSLGLDPATIGLDPATLGLDPANIGLDPSTLGLDPGNLGLDPQTMGLD